MKGPEVMLDWSLRAVFVYVFFLSLEEMTLTRTLEKNTGPCNRKVNKVLIKNGIMPVTNVGHRQCFVRHPVCS
jgi:hypothetical protein